MTNGAQSYREAVQADVEACLSEKGVQPILFLGSGVSRRYFDAPDWNGLLAEMARVCPTIDRDFAYYQQSFASLRHIGQEFAERFKEWAWEEGRGRYPEEYFDARFGPDIFLKHEVTEYLQSNTPNILPSDEDYPYRSELLSIQQIRPHAIITTNYDQFLEILFPDYNPIVGQDILRAQNAFFGEIFKIHGCVTNPSSLVLTQSDYEEFSSKKKYLSAKLLTFFVEHPMLFIGYSAEDPNIKSILSDIDIILSPDNELIPNIFLLRRPKPEESGQHLPREELIAVGEDRRVRIHTIVSANFEWVFDAFGTAGAMERIRPELLRSLLARTYDLVRHDIPKRTVEVDYDILESAVDGDNELARLLGITVIGDAADVNIGFPHTLTQVGRELGFRTWHGANKLLEKIRENTEIDLKSTDNGYHIAVRVGTRTIFHKYSPHTVNLLRSMHDNPNQAITLDPALLRQ